MAAFEKRIRKDGTFSYQVNIRKKKYNITKTFCEEEDARLFAYYKEKLIDNMENFEVDIQDRVTFKQIIELKIKSLDSEKSAYSFLNCYKKIMEHIKPHTFIVELSFEDWTDCAKKMYCNDVCGHIKNKIEKRPISLKTVRNNFAYASSAFSYAISKGIKLENHPFMVINQYINSLEKNKPS